MNSLWRAFLDELTLEMEDTMRVVQGVATGVGFIGGAFLMLEV